MNKFVLIIAVLFLAKTSFGQKLTLSEIFTICNKSNWNNVNDYLLKKGWQYYESKKGDNENYNEIIWSYEKNYNSDRAEGWFHLYTYEGFPNKISYSFFNLPSYNIITSGIGAARMQLVDKSIEDNELITKYENSNFVITIRTAKSEKERNYSNDNSTTTYHVHLIKKEGIYDSENGKKKEYYENGNLKAEYFLTKGKLNGSLKTYHDNGNFEKIGYYINGVENGVFIEFKENGSKTMEYTMVRGKANGMLTMYEDGRKFQEINKVNGISTGKFTEYYYDHGGNIYSKYEGELIDEQQFGLWKKYIINDTEEEVVEFTTYSDSKKNGPFKKYVSSDTIEIGSYKYEVLHGQFTRYIKRKSYEMEGDLKVVTNWNKESEGYYYDGFENGKWIYYLFGNKFEEGDYEYGKKTGKWFKYNTLGKHQGHIWQETNYENGKENGLSIVNFELLVDTNLSDGFKSNIFKAIPIKESTNFRNGIMEGEYSLIDSTGLLITKGNYKNDKKDGFWIESNLKIKDNEELYRYYQKGKYIDDKKEGQWNGYITEDTILETITYLNDEINGSLTRYAKENKPKEVFQINHGEMQSLTVYDMSGNNVNHIYNINSIEDDIVNCQLIKYVNNISTATNYEFLLPQFDFNLLDLDEYFTHLVKDSEVIIYNDSFSFETLNGLERNNSRIQNKSTNIYSLDRSNVSQQKWKKEGLFSISEINSKKTILAGQYKNNLKYGKWTLNHEINDIYIEKVFSDDISDVERYYSINSNEPFSGKFILKHSNSEIKCEFKISKGLRHGKSRYYDENGKIIDTIRYERGVLKSK